MSAPLLELQGVSRHFGGLKVLQDVNLSVPAGGIFGLIGPNGAGKTTVFNLITGLLAPSGGDVRFDGRSLVGTKPFRIRSNIGVNVAAKCSAGDAVLMPNGRS